MVDGSEPLLGSLSGMVMTVTLGTLHLQVPVPAVAVNLLGIQFILWRHANSPPWRVWLRETKPAGAWETTHIVWSYVQETSVEVFSDCRMLYFQASVHDTWSRVGLLLRINIVFGTGCIIECLIPETRGRYKTWLRWVHCHVAKFYCQLRSETLCSSLYGVLLTACAVSLFSFVRWDL